MIIQANNTVNTANKTGAYISSTNETKLMIDLNEPDYNFVTQHATSISTYWFIDCKYYGQTNDFTFVYNFTNPGVTREIGALVIASYNSVTTTTVLPPTTTVAPANVTTPVSNATTVNTTTINSNVTYTTNEMNTTTTTFTTTLPLTVTSANSTTFTTAAPITMTNVNMFLPYICSNTSIIPPDPNKTYGYFYKTIYVRG